MATVEVEQESWEAAQRVLALYQKLASDPKAKKPFQQAIKQIAPQYQTEDDAAAELAKPYVEQLEAMKKELGDFKKSAEDKERAAREANEDRTLAQRLQATRDKWELTDSGMKKLTDFMVERKIADPEDAMKIIDHDKPKPIQGISYESSRWITDINKDADNGRPTFKDWLTDERGTADKELAAALNDIRGARQSA